MFYEFCANGMGFFWSPCRYTFVQNVGNGVVLCDPKQPVGFAGQQIVLGIIRVATDCTMIADILKIIRVLMRVD